ncbi:MAG: TRAP transporter substrate-binding protein [Bacteroidia bacterium]|nr:TRAP transporter substrate-binding protein [Bacteroidia bacterium]
MKRKDFLKKGAAAVAGSALLASGCRPPGWDKEHVAYEEGDAVAQGRKYEWTMVTTWPPNFPVLGEGCQLFSDMIFAMSGGRMKIKVYGGGELLPPMEAFDGVSAGTVQMANGAAYYWAGKIKAAQFFASVPFGMNAQQMNAWIVRGGGQELWDELYAPYDVKPFPSGNTGVQMGGWFNKEINSLADLQGLKIRMPGLGGKVISAAGASAINIAGQELYTSLERSIIDAAEWIGPYHDYLMGFHKIAKYYYYPGWHETGTMLETIVNKSAFEALPLDLQEIIKAAIYWQNVFTISEFEAQNSGYLTRMINEGVTLRQYPDEVIAELKIKTKEVLQEMIADDEPSRKAYEAFSKFQKEVSGWANYSESVYYQSLMEKVKKADVIG